MLLKNKLNKKKILPEKFHEKLFEFVLKMNLKKTIWFEIEMISN